MPASGSIDEMLVPCVQRMPIEEVLATFYLSTLFSEKFTHK